MSTPTCDAAAELIAHTASIGDSTQVATIDNAIFDVSELPFGTFSAGCSPGENFTFSSYPRPGRRSVSSATSSNSDIDGSDSTSITTADSEISRIFDSASVTGTEMSVPRSWGTVDSDSGDGSVNSALTLPLQSVSGDSVFSGSTEDRGDSVFSNSTEDRRYIPNLNNFAAGMARDHDPAPATKSHLPCPFRWDGCDVKYDIEERSVWIAHSIQHFGGIPPPAHLICTYGDCPERFIDQQPKGGRILNWKKCLDHFAEHVRERVEEARAQRGWAADDDLNLEALAMREIEENLKIDINFQQYMVHHGANGIGMDMHINPKPPSELDEIPVEIMNRMPEAYGGRRRREVVFGPYEVREDNLNSRSAGVLHVCDNRRPARAVKLLPARTAVDAPRPFQPQLPRPHNLNERRIARSPSERIIRK